MSPSLPGAPAPGAVTVRLAAHEEHGVREGVLVTHDGSTDRTAATRPDRLTKLTGRVGRRRECVGMGPAPGGPTPPRSDYPAQTGRPIRGALFGL